MCIEIFVFTKLKIHFQIYITTKTVIPYFDVSISSRSTSYCYTNQMNLFLEIFVVVIVDVQQLF